MARDIAAILGASQRRDGYFEGGDWCVTWTFGHLCCLKEPHDYSALWKPWTLSRLPMVPDKFGIKLIDVDSYKRQFAVIKSLIERADEVINCGDAGQEGELIQRWVMQKADIKCPVKRLWISSLTDESIREGFQSLEPAEKFDNLYLAGLSRAIGDWLLGMNATRLYSLRYGGGNRNILSVGRVQTPTLALIVERQREIDNFTPEDYWELHTDYRGADFSASSGRFTNHEKAKDALEKVKPLPLEITSVSKKAGREAPPRLFDLTSLQVECNRRWGWTADDTLKLIQSLYEKKVTTYPRVDTTYLSEDIYPKVPDILKRMTPYAAITAPVLGAKIPKSKKVFDNTKVTDHHAIIPTAEFVKQGFSGLADSEKKLLSLVCCKLLCAVAPAHEYEAVTAVFTCAGQEFTAKGKTVLAAGWKDIDRRFRASLKTDADEDGEAAPELPAITEGQVFEDVAASVTEHFTSPPKPYTEDTLLSAMERAGAEDMPDDAERKGLGTPATRASILEKLVQMGFVQRKGKQLLPTKDGINLAAVLPEALTSPALTAEWETRLSEIAKGEADPDEFMAGIEAQARNLVTAYSCISEDKQKLFQTERVAIGTCPRCGEAVYEGKKNYYCGNRACQFVMWKNDRFFEERKKAFTPKIAAALLKHGKVKIKGLFSPKTGKTYDGTVLLADTGGKYVNFRMEWKK